VLLIHGGDTIYAIIKTGGKQYKVTAGMEILIEKLDAAEGKAVELQDVIMINTADKLIVGSPTIAGAAVKATSKGVEKGEKEAERLMEEAQNRRKMLIEEAQTEAKEIIRIAQKQAEDLKQNTESELKLYAAQAMETLKSEIANLITAELVNQDIKAVFQQNDFMQKIILKLVSEWSQKEKLTIATEDAEALKKYFEVHAKQLLDKGLKIEKVAGKPRSFTISPADGTYKIIFGEDEFIAYFKDFLRPQLIDLLF
jgi:V/A-type H+-transporting ATPase subunit E